MGAPTVSVLMNCLNGERWLREAIESVQAQTYENWELIFWDDQSADASWWTARQMANSDPRIKCFRGPGGQTLGMSRTLATSKARGAYLSILDCDDLWDPYKMAFQMEMMQNPALAFCFSDCEIIDEEGQLTGFAFARTPPPADGQTLYRALLTRPNFMLCPTICFRTEAVRKAGSFRLTFGSAETYDLCVRLSQDQQAAWTPMRLAQHRRHPGQFNGTGKAAIYHEVLQVMQEHRSWRHPAQIRREIGLWGKLAVKTLAHT